MAYATVDEFLRRMRVDTPSAAQTTAAQGALDAAFQEIRAYLGWLDTAPSLGTDELALLEVVNIDRAAEHWRLTPYGALGQGPDLPPVLTARDSFYRHRRKLASLKTSWGVG